MLDEQDNEIGSATETSVDEAFLKDLNRKHEANSWQQMTKLMGCLSSGSDANCNFFTRIFNGSEADT